MRNRMKVLAVVMVMGAGMMVARRAAADAGPVAAGQVSETQKQFAVLDAEVQKRRAELQIFSQQHSLSTTMPQVQSELLLKMNVQLMDIQLEQVGAKQHLASLKQAAAPDAVTAEAQGAIDVLQAKMDFLVKSRDAQSRRVQDLDYFLRQYEEKQTELEVIEKARAELLVKKIQEDAGKGGG